MARVPQGVVAQSMPTRDKAKIKSVTNRVVTIGGTDYIECLFYPDSWWRSGQLGMINFFGGRSVQLIAKVEYIDEEWKITQYAQGRLFWQPQVNV